MKTEIAVLGGGCFWCLDAVFRELAGVEKVVCGYAGGSSPAPDYEQVCTGNSGHAEVVALHFNAERISFTQLLQVFFAIHDPTTLNRQGHDVGSQYRSVVFCQNETQALAVETQLATLRADPAFAGRPPVTEVVRSATPFWPAEAYHQDYFAQHPGQGYCQLVVAPKLAKFRQSFSELRKT